MVGRDVAYIHCLNHVLALVFKNTLSNASTEVDDFFELVRNLYIFFRIPQINKLYSGVSLKKFIETRWTGHLYAVSAIKNSKDEVLATLRNCKSSKKVDAKHRAQAKGYLAEVEDDMNSFLLIFMNEVCETLNILTQSFEKCDSNISTSLETLSRVRIQINNLKEKYSIDYLKQLFSPEIEEVEPPAKRARTVPSRFNDSVILERLPVYRHVADVDAMRRILVEIINTLNSEMDSRFDKTETDLWKSYENLNPVATDFLSADKLKSLFEYALEIPAVRRCIPDATHKKLDSECDVFREMLKQEFDRLKAEREKCKKNEKKGNIMNGLTKYILELSGAKILQQLYLVAVTAGYSASVVECCFSAMNRIDTPHRRKMTPYREADLTLLHFENKLTRNIKFKDFKKLWLKKPRLLSIPSK